MKELDKKFLLYYVSKRLVKNAEWDEVLERFYVRLEDSYISLNIDEYKYLEELANWDGEE